ncbi:MAG: GNAT family N-acetyltransferase [Pseudomonadota bacterium]
MDDATRSLTARTVASIDDVDAEQWDRLANPAERPHNPFVSHAFLSALERSKSVAPELGWAPAHILIEDGGALVGAAPVYAKGHSQGEYIFDHHWADAYHRAGGNYYPKLLCAVPFTPVAGPRLLARNEQARAALCVALENVAQRAGASSAHVNFTTDADNHALKGAGYLQRIGEQYHWFNRGYASFDDFLEALSSRKRKAIRRERRSALSSGLHVRRLVGNEITEAHWDAFWRFYQDTGARKWGRPYLTRSFFRIIAETMADQLLLIVAECEGEPIAGALNFIGGDALYGRYWGCVEDHPFLHFEICYYQAIDVAIERGLSRVEAGAQGRHKVARGYEPVPTYSAHWIANASFKDAIERYVAAEREDAMIEIEDIRQFTPFKKSG